MKGLSPVGLPTLAIADAATTPVPTDGVSLVYSSITEGLMLWSGAQWESIPPNDVLYNSNIQGGTGTITYYISTTGNDNNPGTFASPWKTLAHAANVFSSMWNDLAFSINDGITIKMMPGTYNETQQINFCSYASNNAPYVTIESNSGLYTDVIVNLAGVSSYPALLSAQVANVSFSGITFNAGANSTYFFLAQFWGFIALANCTVNVGSYTINSIFATLYTSDNIWLDAVTVSGNANYLVNMQYGGRTFLLSTFTFVSTPTYSSCAYFIGNNAILDITGLTSFSGSFIGQTYQLFWNGIINAGSELSSSLPGTIAGTFTSGGRYLSTVSDKAEVKPYVSTNNYIVGDQVLWNDILVTPNANVSAGTAFAWGTTGATWMPVKYSSVWQGVYNSGTSYSAGAAVVASTTSNVIYISQYGPNLGVSLSCNAWADVEGVVTTPLPSINQVALTFGSSGVGVPSNIFTITSIPCAVGQKIIMTPSADLVGASIVNSDELDMDNFICAATVTATNTIKAYIMAIPGPVAGTYNFNLMAI